MVKFLIIHLDNLSDYLMSTPVIRGLSQQVEESEVHYLTSTALKETVSQNPYLGKVLELKDNLDETIDDLLVEDYNYIIDLQLNSFTHRIKQKIPVVSFEYEALNFRQWLYVNFKINRLPEVHLVDRFMDTVKVFDVKPDGKGIDFIIPQGEDVDPKSMHSVFEGKFMTVSLDSKHETQNIPNDKLASIINMSGVPVCLLGSDNMINKASQLEQNLKVPFLNAVGKITLNQSASLIQQSTLLLSPESDYLHLATAFNVPILSLWGNTVQNFGRTSYLPNEHSEAFEVNHLRCRPCTKRGFEACPKKHFKCMNDIDNAAIINKITALIN